MKHIEDRFVGQKKVVIFRRCWLPPGEPKAKVVLVHGLGEHSGRYRHVAERLVAAGCAVFAADHRGHGQSQGPRAFVDRFRHLVADLDQVVDHARRTARNRPLFLLGHSMGGAVALSYAIRHQQKLDGLILSGPAVALDGAPPFLKPLSRILSALAPKLGMFAIDPSAVSRNPEVVTDYGRDPLNCHGKVPARTLAEIVGFVEWLPAVLPELTLPLLVMHGGDDRLAGVAGGEMVVQRAASADKTFKLYEGLYHEIFNELPVDQERVLGDLVQWVSARLAA